MELNAILAKLPYRAPFLFVDELIHVDDEGVAGTYTFDEDLDFYRGHFYDRAITPGVILIETMAQIGLACLGIFLLNKDLMQGSSIALTSTEIQFLKPVYPKEKVTVFSKKIYFRFGKLKCAVTMKNEAGQEVCKGILAGMMTEEL
ncbi:MULTISPECIES: 3-hydroxyacyl-ACP dehydratase FabZ family protein [Sphingobacterium]|jgi:3-hydroxyacyl-[acyl-carrier-protein] dehydratase|uniref:3-hydroxyacyl-ACP dehydratase FabZ family protein n=2 Tax=Sphingobacterium TaxID=28453 RepID=A0ACD5C5B9_9SPHI|nr:MULTISPECIES: 3-hydroxyacyl-ACP dehydratase FabZ family protein [Sphingobacterium]HAE67558.1 hydroxymyristoyl-ACP dehydratase [Sphingobacterium sp.]MDF2851523.1 hydroxymyristoyl-ACP dehydratase [Sphingobacterium multivorum]OFV11050.1 hydroxymyristoyl-ACP dehydratase [Sphingobacterium sp. HMSC13C05]OJZ07449.1 MAG: hydroxymyristoyl-ACP dehydratase [Sphingobacterium sp. 40-24]QQT45288.1 beta-hydroxyacyl-ACP dehydratase [Sphingobacterium multivorum]